MKLAIYNVYQYLVNKIHPNLFVFAEENPPLYEDWGRAFYVNSMQLIIGTERAVLIDTGYGRGDLMPLVRRYTDLPVTLLITHSSYDHWRGAYQFKDVYMSAADQAIIEELKEESGVRFDAKDIKDGDIFDLGGIQLETIHVPGHTWGSMCFLDRKNNTLFTGDAVNRLPYVFSSGVMLTQYREALIRLRDMTPEQPAVFCGHSLEPYPYHVIADSITACDEVLAGNTQDDIPLLSPTSPSRPPYANAFMHETGIVRLCYGINHLR